MFNGFMSVLSAAASWVWLASWKGIAVIALVLLCRRLLAPWLSAPARCSLWFAAIVSLTIPFGLQFDAHLPRLPWDSLWSMEREKFSAADHAAMDIASSVSRQRTANIVSEDAVEYRIAPVQAPSAAARIFNRIWWVTLWGSVACGVLAATLWNLLRYLRIKAAAQEVAAPVRQLFLQCKSQLGMSRGVRVLEAREIGSPVLFGWWSPAILLPPGLPAQLDENQLRHVFLHELSHVRRHDILLNWAITAVQAVHWFNPLVWYGLRLMRADMEQACDAAVMCCLSQRERLDYADTLIKLTDLHPGRMPAVQGIGMAENHSQLRGRIQMIARFEPGKLRYSLAAVIALTATAALAIAQPRIDSTQPAGDAAAATVDAPVVLKMPVQHEPQILLGAAPAVPFKTRKPHASPASDGTQGDDVVTEVRHLAYIKAEDAVKQIKEHLQAIAAADATVQAATGATSRSAGHGDVMLAADKKNNFIIVNASPEIARQIMGVVDQLDISQPANIALDIILAQVSVDKITQLGAGWELQNPSYFVVSPAGDLRVRIAGAEAGFDALVRGLRNDANTRIISLSRITVGDNKEAELRMMPRVPFIVGEFANEAWNGTTDDRVGSFQALKPGQLGTVLRIIPQIGQDNAILLKVSQENSNVDDAGSMINKRTVTTKLLVEDGNTVAMGGTIRDNPAPGDLKPGENRAEGASKAYLMLFIRSTIQRDVPVASR